MTTEPPQTVLEQEKMTETSEEKMEEVEIESEKIDDSKVEPIIADKRQEGSHLFDDMYNQFCGLLQPLEEFREKEVVSDSDLTERMSPFVAYEDGYEWPDLYSEVSEMFETCALIYPLAELRKMAREQPIFGRELILSTPLTHEQVMGVVEANRQELIKTDKQFGEDFYFDILMMCEERDMLITSVDDSDKRETGVLIPASIVAFDDEFEQEELVYMITVNHVRKRVTVCFRGSVTKMDWTVDFEMYMKKVENPMKNHKFQEPHIKLHNGFCDYLFKPSSRGVQGPNGEDLSEYQEILQEHVVPVLRKYPDYKVSSINFYPFRLQCKFRLNGDSSSM